MVMETFCFFFSKLVHYHIESFFIHSKANDTKKNFVFENSLMEKYNVTNYPPVPEIVYTIVYVSGCNKFSGQFSLPNDKRQMYEFDIRVPFMARGPGIKPGQVREVCITVV